MKAVKDNRVYTISEADKTSFQKEGYDILDDNGHVVAYGAGKTVPIDKYMALLQKYEALEKENEELRKKKAKKEDSKKE